MKNFLKFVWLLLFFALLGRAFGDKTPSEFAYIAPQDIAAVFQFQVGSDGTLVPLDPPQVQTGLGARHGGVAASLTGRFVYVTNTNRGTISQFRAGVDGALSPLTPDTVAAGHAPNGIVFSPGGLFAYVLSFDEGIILQYRVSPTGQLHRLPTASISCSVRPKALMFDPAGRFAYAVGADGVLSYRVGADGALAALAPAEVPCGNDAGGAAVTPDGKFAYVSCLNGVFQYHIGQDGRLMPLTTPSVGPGGATIFPLGQDLAIDPAGHFLYTIRHVNNGNGLISEYRIGVDGTLMLVTATAAETGNGPTGLRVDPSGRYAYATTLNYVMTQFRIGTDGGLSPILPAIRGGGGALAFARHSSSFRPAPPGPLPVAHPVPPPAALARPAYVYVANTSTDSLTFFQVMPDGRLSILGRQKTGSQPRSIVADPKGHFLYVVCAGNQHVWQYHIESGGFLSSLSPATAPAGDLPFCAAITPDGKFVYVANYLSGTISAFLVSADGRLAPLPAPFPTGPQPAKIVVDTAGRFVYVSCNGDDQVRVYRVAPDGALSGEVVLNNRRRGDHDVPSFTPVGHFGYSTNINGFISQFRFGADGLPTPLSPPSLSAERQAGLVAVDPTGKFAYASNEFENSISQFRIGPNGTLTPISPATVVSGSHPGPIAFDPAGHFAYVLNASEAAIAQYQINADGALSPLLPIQVPSGKLSFMVPSNAVAVVPVRP